MTDAAPACADCARSYTREIHGRTDLACRRVGHAACFERDHVPEPQRPAGDKCGPGAKHFIARGTA